MTKRSKPFVLLALIIAMVITQGLPIFAAKDNYPNKPIRLIIPYSPGGAQETAVRQWMPYLEKELGVPLKVDCIPGANAIIGNNVAAQSAPDGYTFVQMTLSDIPVQTLIYKAPFKADAFEIITNYISDPMVVLVHKDSPWNTLQDLITYAKQNPGKVTFGQSSLTATGSLTLYALEEAAGIDLNIISFGGGNQSRLALAGKHTDATFTGLFSSQNISEYVKVLAVGQEKNLWKKLTNNAPTINDALKIKIPNALDSISLFVPAGFAKQYPDRYKKFTKAFFKALENPDYKANLKKLGDGRVMPKSVEESQKLLQEHFGIYTRYQDLFKDQQQAK